MDQGLLTTKSMTEPYFSATQYCDKGNHTQIQFLSPLKQCQEAPVAAAAAATLIKEKNSNLLFISSE